jgi:hypothetical protein
MTTCEAGNSIAERDWPANLSHSPTRRSGWNDCMVLPEEWHPELADLGGRASESFTHPLARPHLEAVHYLAAL